MIVHWLLRHKCRSVYCLARVLLVVVNGGHILVHGTPLDSGALDSLIYQFDQALMPVAMAGD